MIFSTEKIRKQFPIFSKKMKNGKKLIYFDNAATTQKPISVIEREMHFYKYEYSSIHRGVYYLSDKATEIVEEVRKKVANFINAKSNREVIFTKGTTEGINFLANTLGKFLKKNDTIISTIAEHHSNFVPWQILSKKKNIDLKLVSILKNGNLDYKDFLSLINSRVKIVTIAHISNVLGKINPIFKIIKKIRKKRKDIIIIIDGAQSIAHQKIDVQKLDCDFYVFSAHKMYGPSGLGILFGKKKLLKNISPWEFGGAMVRSVSLKKTTFQEFPWKFESGTTNISGIVALGESIKFIKKIGIEKIINHEKNLFKYALEKFKNIKDIKFYQNYESDCYIGIIPFNIKEYNSYDIGLLLDKFGIAIRTGHHCAMPLMSFFGVSGMCRVSFGIYNEISEIDYFISKIEKIRKILL